MCSLAFKQAGNTTSPTGFSSNKTTNLPIRCVACVSDIKFSPPFMSQSNFSFFLSPFNYRETFSCFAVGIQMMSQDEKSSRYVGPSGFACANALIWDATTWCDLPREGCVWPWELWTSRWDINRSLNRELVLETMALPPLVAAGAEVCWLLS